MSEVVENVQVQDPAQEQVDMRALEALVFNEPFSNQQQQSSSPTEVGNTSAPATTETPSTTVAGPIQPTVEETVVDEYEYLKQQVGYDNWETLKADLAAYKGFKENPPQAEIKFANEEAKKWLEYFTEGKEDDLYNSLHNRRMIRDVDTMGEEQKLKLLCKMQNPLYQQQHIDYWFKKEYGFDESSFKDDDGNITDQIGYDFAKISAQQKMQNDIAKANDYFTQYKTKIDLPQIQPQQQQNTGSEDFAAYQASLAKEAELYETVVKPTLSSLKEGDFQFNIAVNDPNNQMQFDAGVAADAESFKIAIGHALNITPYLESLASKDGKFAPERLVKMILLEQNFDKYAQSIARQAVNAERKRVIAKETPTAPGARNYQPMEKTEMDQLADRVFSV